MAIYIILQPLPFKVKKKQEVNMKGSQKVINTLNSLSADELMAINQHDEARVYYHLPLPQGEKGKMAAEVLPIGTFGIAGITIGRTFSTTFALAF